MRAITCYGEAVQPMMKLKLHWQILIAISIILAAVGVPLEGIGLLMVTDRILDMLRTSVNVFSDSCCAVVIARSEGVTDLYPPADAVVARV